MMQAELKVDLSEETMNELYSQVYTITQQAIEDATKSSDKLFYTQNEVREILRCGQEQLNRYYAMGLPSIQQGRTILVQKHDLINFMDTLKN